MANINKEIKKYLVRIEFNGDTSGKQNGSGVIVKASDENSIYVFTAKHTFEKDQDDTERGILYEKSEIITYTKIVTIDKEELFIQSIIGLDNINENIDFLIFKVNNNSALEGISPLAIYNDEFEKCIVSGFPAVKNYQELEYIPSQFIHSDKSYYFEFDPKKIVFTSEDTEIDVIGGISGGGVFVEGNDGVVYLAGIETGIYGVNNLEAIYLIKIIEKINKKLGTKILLGGFKALSGFENQPLSLEFLADNLKNDYIKAMENEENILDALEDDRNEKYKELETKFNETKKSIKDLSISYLYRGIKFNGVNNYKATANFKKAILLNKEEVEIYFDLAKSKRVPNSKQIDVNLDDEKKKRFIEINKLKNQIENTDNYDFLEELYRELLYILRKGDERNEVVEYQKALINLYIQNQEFNQAERELLRKNKELDKSFTTEKLTEIYLNDDYTKQLNDEEVAKKLFDLLVLLEHESDKDKVRYKIDELNLYNQNMLVLNEKFSTMEYQIKDYQSKIEILTGMLSSETKNNDVLQQVLQTDEKLSKKIDTRADKIDNTLNIINEKIKRTNNHKLDKFLESIYRSNHTLVSKIQATYHQNDRISKKAQVTLNNSIKSMNEKMDNLLREKPTFDSFNADNTNIMDEVKQIIEQSNWSFYQGIRGLFEKEQDSYNRKLLEMYMTFTKKEHALHIENLTSLHKRKIDSLETEIDNLAIDYQESENSFSIKEKELSRLQEKYTRLKKQISSSAETLTNIEKLGYEDEIESLQRSIEQLKGKGEQINDLKESISLSSETARTLENLVNVDKQKIETYITKVEQKYQDVDEKQKGVIQKQFDEVLTNIHTRLDSLEYEPLDKDDFEKILLELEGLDGKLDKLEDNFDSKIHEITQRFYKVAPKVKNQKRYRNILNTVKKFEKDLNEITQNSKLEYKSEITLHLLESDLEKIELIMRKRAFSFYNIYCFTRFFILGVIANVTLIFLYLEHLV